MAPRALGVTIGGDGYAHNQRIADPLRRLGRRFVTLGVDDAVLDPVQKVADGLDVPLAFELLENPIALRDITSKARQVLHLSGVITVCHVFTSFEVSSVPRCETRKGLFGESQSRCRESNPSPDVKIRGI